MSMTMGAQASETTIFNRILCGVDETPASLVAVRQATRLLDDAGTLHLAAVAYLAKAVHAGMAATHAAQQLQQDAEVALAAASAVAPNAEGRVFSGEPAAVLLREAEAERATLVAVGSHGRSRVAGMMLGTVAARMLHDAPCSVLIARAPEDPDTWPESVVVGVDGSLESAAAVTVARSLARRFGASLRTLASTTDHLDRDAAHAVAPELEERPTRAVDLLATASETADLVIVGSRGLHGLKSLGSVSERVAYQTRSSVLVVRPGQG